MSAAQNLPEMALTTAFTRMKAAIEFATGSPLGHSKKNTQKIGDTLAIFYGFSSWHALNQALSAPAQEKSILDTKPTTSRPGELRPPEFLFEGPVAITNVIVPAVARFLLENRADVAFMLGNQVNLQHGFKDKDDDSLVDYFNSAYLELKPEQKRWFLEAFFSGAHLTNFTPADLKDFGIAITGQPYKDGEFIFREIAQNLLYTFGNALSDAPVKQSIQTLFDAFEAGSTDGIEAMLFAVVKDAL